MNKNPAFVNLLASLNKLVNLTNRADNAPPPLEQAPTITEEPSSPELQRIAIALERMATALEKLTDNPKSIEQQNHTEDAWITLPLASLNHHSSTNTRPLAAVEPVPKPTTTLSPTVEPPPASVAIATPDTPTSNPQPVQITEESVILTYLKNRGITVNLTKPQEPSYQEKLERVAFHLGQNYTICKELYQQIRSNLTKPGKLFTYSLKGATIKPNIMVREFCRLLQEAELTEETSYQGAPEYNIQLRTTGKEQKFLCGSWLEYYAKLEIARIVRSYITNTGQLYEALPNLKITFQDNRATELDLLFAVGMQVFCVEAKMRPSQADLTKYLDRIKSLELDKKALLILVADKTEEECQQLSQALGNVTIARFDCLEEKIASMLTDQSLI